MKWITREGFESTGQRHVGSSEACRILRAEFLFARAEEIASIQAESSATGFDAPGATYPHKDANGLCSFAALVERLADDPVLVEMARIVQAADFKDQLDDHPAARGLRLISRVLPSVTKDDQNCEVRGFHLRRAICEYQ